MFHIQLPPPETRWRRLFHHSGSVRTLRCAEGGPCIPNDFPAALPRKEHRLLVRSKIKSQDPVYWVLQPNDEQPLHEVWSYVA
jgi:hypothetical protein